MKGNKSAYSKMYLVTPTVYEKLLSCLDVGEQKAAEKLNIEETVGEDRPSELILKHVGAVDVDPTQLPLPNDPPYDPYLVSVVDPPAPMSEAEKKSILAGEINAPDDVIQNILEEKRKSFREKERVSKLKKEYESGLGIFGVDQPLPTAPPSRQQVITPTMLTSALNQPPTISSGDASIAASAIAPTPTITPGILVGQKKSTQLRPTCVSTKRGKICSVWKPSKSAGPLNLNLKECPTCQRKFSRKSNLDRHMRTVHAGEDVELQPIPTSPIVPLEERENFPGWDPIEEGMEAMPVPSRKRNVTKAKFFDPVPEKVLKLPKDFKQWENK